MISACAPLQPISLPDQHTPQPVDSPLWTSIAENEQNWHALLNYGPDALAWRLRAIDSASQSIDLQTFMWNVDSAGSMVLLGLLKAADRGVIVRILVDDSLLLDEDQVFLALAHHQNIQYRIYNPFQQRSNSFVTRELLNLAEFSRLDHRMHNKAMVIDNHIAIVGGRNLADEYFGFHETANFRDMEILYGGPFVQEISNAFDTYWNDDWAFPINTIAHRQTSLEQLQEAINIRPELSTFYLFESYQEKTSQWLNIKAGAAHGQAMLITDRPPEDNPEQLQEAPVQVAHRLEQLLDDAQDEIIIVSAYLIPTTRLEQTLWRAVDRGVRVRVLTNSLRSNNHVSAHSAYRNHISTLLNSGVELHEVRVDAEDRNRYMLSPVDKKHLALHAKALIIDNDRVFIGSPNLDPRSMRINTEMGVLITSESFNKRVRHAVEIDFSTENAWYLELQPNGKVLWVASDQTRTSQPAASFMQRLEDWFFSTLPIETEL